MTRRREEPLTSALSYVKRSGKHWLWMGSRHHAGYGQFGLAHAKPVAAYRFLFEELVGPIDGKLRNTCGKRHCVWPEHWEA